MEELWLVLAWLAILVGGAWVLLPMLFVSTLQMLGVMWKSAVYLWQLRKPKKGRIAGWCLVSYDATHLPFPLGLIYGSNARVYRELEPVQARVRLLEERFNVFIGDQALAGLLSRPLLGSGTIWQRLVGRVELGGVEGMATVEVEYGSGVRLKRPLRGPIYEVGFDARRWEIADGVFLTDRETFRYRDANAARFRFNRLQIGLRPALTDLALADIDRVFGWGFGDAFMVHEHGPNLWLTGDSDQAYVHMVLRDESGGWLRMIIAKHWGSLVVPEDMAWMEED